MEDYKLIDLNDYVQTGEGGTSLTYTHQTRPTMAKLFNLVNEAETAEREFLTARAVFEMGLPTPEPLQLVTDGKRRGVEYELIKNKRSFTRIISQELPYRQDLPANTGERAQRAERRVPDDHQRLRPSLRPGTQCYGCRISRRPLGHLPLHVHHERNNYSME